MTLGHGGRGPGRTPPSRWAKPRIRQRCSGRRLNPSTAHYNPSTQASRPRCRATRGAPTSISGTSWTPSTSKPYGASSCALGRRDFERPEFITDAQRCGCTPREP
eukprot:3448234-Prymnesium_polylepis.1